MVRITTGWELAENGKAKQVRKTLGYYSTRKEAVIALAEYNKDPYNLDRNSATVTDVWLLCKPRINVSESRMKVYEASWTKYLAPLHNRPISDVKGEELQDVVDACPYGYSTKVIIRTILKHIYAYAMRNDYTSKDYSAYINIEKESVQLERQVYSSEEIENLWKHSDQEYYVFTLILLYQGMRITELRELPFENVDLAAGTIRITEAKNKQSLRIIPIHEVVKPLVQRVCEIALENPGRKLFDFSKHQYEYFAKNILNHNPYDTRHTFATKATNLNVKKVYIQKIMGHKPDSVLEQFYTHLTPEDLRPIINQIEY